MDVATEKTVVIKMTEADAEELLAEIAPLNVDRHPQAARLWQLLDDLLA